MRCRYCGHDNKDDATFCIECGNRLNGTQYASELSNGPAQTSRRRSGGGIRVAGCSITYLVCAISYSLYALFFLISAISHQSGSLSTLYAMANMVPGGVGVMNTFSNGMAVGTLLGMAPTLVIVAGLWIFFADCMNRDTPNVGTAGLTMIKVVIIIQIVVMALGLIAVEIALAAAWHGVSRYSDPGATFLVIMLLCLVIMGLVIFYEWKVVSGINAVKLALNGGRPENTISMFVAVINFIGGCFATLGLVAGRAVAGAVASYTGGMYYGGFWNTLTQLCSAASMIAFGVLIVQKRNSVFQPQTRQSIEPHRPARPQYTPQRQQPAQPQYTPQPGWTPAARKEHVDSRSQTNLLSSASPDTGTTVLSGNQRGKRMAWLERVRNSERIYITATPFRIGKASGGVDYRIADNSAVSRVHAEVTEEDGVYFIVDKRSTNHVYLNDYQIPTEMPVRLQNGARIKLGDEELVFCEQ